jgi:hypothetical protein
MASRAEARHSASRAPRQCRSRALIGVSRTNVWISWSGLAIVLIAEEVCNPRGHPVAFRTCPWRDTISPSPASTRSRPICKWRNVRSHSGLTWRKENSSSCATYVPMSLIGRTISRAALGALATLIVAGLVPLLAGVYQAAHASPSRAAISHECCQPEPTSPDAACSPGCIQAPCSAAALSCHDCGSILADKRVMHWPAPPSYGDGICLEVATPPPRA